MRQWMGKCKQGNSRRSSYLLTVFLFDTNCDIKNYSNYSTVNRSHSVNYFTILKYIVIVCVCLMDDK